MIIFGGKASKIGTFDVSNTKCNYCSHLSTHNVSVFGKYAHIFWIPFFPTGKKAVAECENCKKTIPRKEFSTQLENKYLENLAQVKRPIYHWLGLGVIGIFAAFMTYVIATSVPDPRSEFLTQDQEKMSANPTMESDSISYKIKQIFDEYAADDINPSEFEYLTKITDDKALILMRIPKLRKVEKESRGEVMKLIQLVLENQEVLNDKETYIGVQGLATMLLIKTPSYEDNSRIASQSELLEFYGPKPDVQN